MGLALSQVVTFTRMLEFAVKLWADVENSMTSVERAIEYTNLEQERKDGEVLTNWPSQGTLSFEGVTLRYEGCKTAVLKEMSFEVGSREKIGIVGRTGAGKSSIISALYRLYEVDGAIKIDGVDIRRLNLDYLR